MKIFSVIAAFALALFSAVTFAQAIDINTASAGELEKGLKGIGPSKAAAIVKYREAHGPFQSVNDLTKVPGIKDKSLEKLLADNQDKLTVGGVAAPAEPAAPATPAMPAAPAIKPTAPAVPATPAMPTVPATPVTPAAPATPAMPTTPTVPAQPPKQ